MIDAYASTRQYADHLTPIWLALPEEVRGEFFAPIDVAKWMARPGAPHPVTVDGIFPDPRSRDLVLVASHTDHHAVRPRSTVLVNHGAGQSYLSKRGAEAYSGGPGRENVRLHLEPGPMASRATAAAWYPFVEIGSPRLDPFHAAPPRPSGQVVAIAIRQHTPPQSCPEQRSAWPYYEPVMADLAERFDLLGHGHPRNWERTANVWAMLGVRSTPDSYEVLREASVLVTCSSSLGWEFASTGRPVVWVNSPEWRREVHHGGRWWQALPGYVVDTSDELAPAIDRALSEPFDPAWWEAVAGVYCAVDGKAAQRAAVAITMLEPLA